MSTRYYIKGSISRKAYNKYDVMSFFVIVSLALGYLGGYYAPVRFIVLLFLPSLVRNLKGGTWVRMKPFVIFFLFWSFYNVTSMLWAPHISRAIYHTILFLINFIMFLEILVFSEKASSPHKTIATSWLVAFFLTSIIAFWELQTGDHLSNAKIDYEGREDVMEDLTFGSYVAVGFYNINTYCTYILEVVPFILFILSSRISKKLFIFATYCGLASFLFILVNGSRGSFLSLIIMFAIFALLMVKEGKRRIGSVFVILTVLLLFLVLYSDKLFVVLEYRNEVNGMFEDNSRIVLWEKSLELIKESFGLGTGVGSMIHAMKAQGNIYNIYFSHNFLLELLMQFGLVITIVCIYYFYILFKNSWKTNILPNKVLIYAALLSFPFYSIVNSEYTQLSFVWCYFASLYIYSSKTYSNKFLGVF